jgi:hypothetical protein
MRLALDKLFSRMIWLTVVPLRRAMEVRVSPAWTRYSPGPTGPVDGVDAQAVSKASTLAARTARVRAKRWGGVAMGEATVWENVRGNLGCAAALYAPVVISGKNSAP